MFYLWIHGAFLVNIIDNDYLISNNQSDILKIQNFDNTKNVKINEDNSISIINIINNDIIMSIKTLTQLLNMEFNQNNDLIIKINKKNFTLRGFKNITIKEILYDEIILLINDQEITINIKNDSRLSYFNNNITFIDLDSMEKICIDKLEKNLFIINNHEYKIDPDASIVLNVGKKQKIITKYPIIGIIKDNDINLFHQNFENCKIKQFYKSIGTDIYKQYNQFLYSIGDFNGKILNNTEISCINDITIFEDINIINNITKKNLIYNGSSETKIIIPIKDKQINTIIKPGDTLYFIDPKIFFNKYIDDIFINPNNSKDLVLIDSNIIFKDILDSYALFFEIKNIDNKILVNNLPINKNSIILTKMNQNSEQIFNLSIISKETGEQIDPYFNIIIIKNNNLKYLYFQDMLVTVKIPEKITIIYSNKDNKCYIQTSDNIVPFENNMIIDQSYVITNIFDEPDNSTVTINTNNVIYIKHQNKFTIFTKTIPYGLIINKDRIKHQYEIDKDIIKIDSNLQYKICNNSDSYHILNLNSLTSDDIIHLIKRKNLDFLSLNTLFLNAKFVYKEYNNLILYGDTQNAYMILFNYFKFIEEYRNFSYDFNTNILIHNSETYKNVQNLIYCNRGINSFFEDYQENFNHEIDNEIISEIDVLFFRKQEQNLELFLNLEDNQSIILTNWFENVYQTLLINITENLININDIVFHINIDFDKLILCNKNMSLDIFYINTDDQWVLISENEDIINIQSECFVNGIIINKDDSLSNIKINNEDIIINSIDIKNSYFYDFIIQQDNMEYFPKLQHNFINNNVPISILNHEDDATVFISPSKKLILKFFNNINAQYSQSYLTINQDSIRISDNTEVNLLDYDILFPPNSIYNFQTSFSFWGKLNDNNLILNSSYFQDVLLYNYQKKPESFISLKFDNMDFYINSLYVTSKAIFIPEDKTDKNFILKTNSKLYNFTIDIDTILYLDDQILRIQPKGFKKNSFVSMVDFLNNKIYINNNIFVNQNFVSFISINLQQDVLFFPIGIYKYNNIQISIDECFYIIKNDFNGILNSVSFDSIELLNFFNYMDKYKNISINNTVLNINNLKNILNNKNIIFCPKIIDLDSTLDEFIVQTNIYPKTNFFFKFEQNNIKIIIPELNNIQTIFNGKLANKITVDNQKIIIDNDIIDNNHESIEYKKGNNIIDSIPILLSDDFIIRNKDDFLDFISLNNSFKLYKFNKSIKAYLDIDIQETLNKKIKRFLNPKTLTPFNSFNNFVYFPDINIDRTYQYKNIQNLTAQQNTEIFIYDDDQLDFLILFGEFFSKGVYIPKNKTFSNIEVYIDKIRINDITISHIEDDFCEFIPNKNENYFLDNKVIKCYDIDETFPGVYVVQNDKDLIIKHLNIVIKNFFNNNFNILINKDSVTINDIIFSENFKNHIIDFEGRSLNGKINFNFDITSQFISYKTMADDLFLLLPNKTKYIIFLNFFNCDESINNHYVENNKMIDINQNSIKINNQEFRFLDENNNILDFNDLIYITNQPNILKNTVLYNNIEIVSDSGLFIKKNDNELRFFLPDLISCPNFLNSIKKIEFSNKNKVLYLPNNEKHKHKYDFKFLNGSNFLSNNQTKIFENTNTKLITFDKDTNWQGAFFKIQNKNLFIDNVIIHNYKQQDTSFYISSNTLSITDNINTYVLKNLEQFEIIECSNQNIAFDNFIIINEKWTFFTKENLDLVIINQNNNIRLYNFFTDLNKVNSKYKNVKIDKNGFVYVNNFPRKGVFIPALESYKNIVTDFDISIEEDIFSFINNNNQEVNIQIFNNKNQLKNINFSYKNTDFFQFNDILCESSNLNYIYTFYSDQILRIYINNLGFNIKIFNEINSIKLGQILSINDKMIKIVDKDISIDLPSLQYIDKNDFSIIFNGEKLSIYDLSTNHIISAFENYYIKLDQNQELYLCIKPEFQNLCGKYIKNDLILYTNTTKNKITLIDFLNQYKLYKITDFLEDSQMSIIINNQYKISEDACVFINNNKNLSIKKIYNVDFYLDLDVIFITHNNTLTIKNNNFTIVLADFSNNTIYKTNIIYINNQNIQIDNFYINLNLHNNIVFLPIGIYNFSNIYINNDFSCFIVKENNHGIIKTLLKNSDSITNVKLNNLFSNMDKYNTINYSDNCIQINNMIIKESNINIAIPGTKNTDNTLTYVSDKYFQYKFDPDNNLIIKSDDNLEIQNISPDIFQTGTINIDSERIYINNSFDILFKKSDLYEVDTYKILENNISFSTLTYVSIEKSNLKLNTIGLNNETFYLYHFSENNSYNNWIIPNTLQNIISDFYLFDENINYQSCDNFMYIPASSFQTSFIVDNLNINIKNTELIIYTGIENYLIIYIPNQITKGLKIAKNQNIEKLIFTSDKLISNQIELNYKKINGTEFIFNNHIQKIENKTISFKDNNPEFIGTSIKKDNNNLIILHNNFTIKDFFSNDHSLIIKQNSIIYNNNSYFMQNDFILNILGEYSQIFKIPIELYKKQDQDLYTMLPLNKNPIIFKNFFINNKQIDPFYTSIVIDEQNKIITVNQNTYSFKNNDINIESLTFYKNIGNVPINNNTTIKTDTNIFVYTKDNNITIFTDKMQKGFTFNNWNIDFNNKIEIQNQKQCILFNNIEFSYETLNDSCFLCNNIINQDKKYNIKFLNNDHIPGIIYKIENNILKISNQNILNLENIPYGDITITKDNLIILGKKFPLKYTFQNNLDIYIENYCYNDKNKKKPYIMQHYIENNNLVLNIEDKTKQLILYDFTTQNLYNTRVKIGSPDNNDLTITINNIQYTLQNQDATNQNIEDFLNNYDIYYYPVQSNKNNMIIANVPMLEYDNFIILGCSTDLKMKIKTYYWNNNKKIEVNFQKNKLIFDEKIIDSSLNNNDTYHIIFSNENINTIYNQQIKINHSIDYEIIKYNQNVGLLFLKHNIILSDDILRYLKKSEYIIFIEDNSIKIINNKNEVMFTIPSNTKDLLFYINDTDLTPVLRITQRNKKDLHILQEGVTINKPLILKNYYMDENTNNINFKDYGEGLDKDVILGYDSKNIPFVKIFSKLWILNDLYYTKTYKHFDNFIYFPSSITEPNISDIFFVNLTNFWCEIFEEPGYSKVLKLFIKSNLPPVCIYGFNETFNYDNNENNIIGNDCYSETVSDNRTIHYEQKGNNNLKITITSTAVLTNIDYIYIRENASNNDNIGFAISGKNNLIHKIYFDPNYTFLVQPKYDENTKNGEMFLDLSVITVQNDKYLNIERVYGINKNYYAGDFLNLTILQSSKNEIVFISKKLIKIVNNNNNTILKTFILRDCDENIVDTKYNYNNLGIKNLPYIVDDLLICFNPQMLNILPIWTNIKNLDFLDLKPYILNLPNEPILYGYTNHVKSTNILALFINKDEYPIIFASFFDLNLSSVKNHYYNKIILNTDQSIQINNIDIFAGLYDYFESDKIINKSKMIYYPGGQDDIDNFYDNYNKIFIKSSNAFFIKPIEDNIILYEKNLSKGLLIYNVSGYKNTYNEPISFYMEKLYKILVKYNQSIEKFFENNAINIFLNIIINEKNINIGFKNTNTQPYYQFDSDTISAIFPSSLDKNIIFRTINGIETYNIKNFDKQNKILPINVLCKNHECYSLFLYNNIFYTTQTKENAYGVIMDNIADILVIQESDKNILQSNQIIYQCNMLFLFYITGNNIVYYDIYNQKFQSTNITNIDQNLFDNLNFTNNLNNMYILWKTNNPFNSMFSKDNKCCYLKYKQDLYIYQDNNITRKPLVILKNFFIDYLSYKTNPKYNTQEPISINESSIRIKNKTYDLKDKDYSYIYYINTDNYNNNTIYNNNNESIKINFINICGLIKFNDKNIIVYLDGTESKKLTLPEIPFDSKIDFIIYKDKISTNIVDLFFMDFDDLKNPLLFKYFTNKNQDIDNNNQDINEDDNNPDINEDDNDQDINEDDNDQDINKDDNDQDMDNNN